MHLCPCVWMPLWLCLHEYMPLLTPVFTVQVYTVLLLLLIFVQTEQPYIPPSPHMNVFKLLIFTVSIWNFNKRKFACFFYETMKNKSLNIMYSIQSSNKISKGGGLWIKFSIKSCPLIGPNHSHVIKYWPLIGGEEKWFNWSLQREGVIENQELSNITI